MVMDDRTLQSTMKLRRREFWLKTSFGPGLSDAQPVGYLNELPFDRPSALLFIVPEERVQSVWGELKKRCDNANTELKNEYAGKRIVWGRLDQNRVIAITSWKHTLSVLENVDANTAAEVQQLRGLANTMTAEAFAPIREVELTNAALARRMINFSNLVEPVVETLKTRGLADTDGLRPTHGYYSAGRYLRMHGRLGLWLGVDLRAWRNSGSTPLWLAVDPSEWSGVGSAWDDIETIFDDVQSIDDRKYIPIKLIAGVEFDSVVFDAANQVEWIAKKL